MICEEFICVLQNWRWRLRRVRAATTTTSKSGDRGEYGEYGDDGCNNLHRDYGKNGDVSGDCDEEDPFRSTNLNRPFSGLTLTETITAHLIECLPVSVMASTLPCSSLRPTVNLPSPSHFLKSDTTHHGHLFKPATWPGTPAPPSILLILILYNL